MQVFCKTAAEQLVKAGHRVTEPLRSEKASKNPKFNLNPSSPCPFREPFGLEKASEVIESNPSPPHHAHYPHPAVPPSPQLWDTPRDGDPTTPWAAVPLPHRSLGEGIAPNSQPEPPLAQLKDWSRDEVMSPPEHSLSQALQSRQQTINIQNFSNTRGCKGSESDHCPR